MGVLKKAFIVQPYTREGRSWRMRDGRRLNTRDQALSLAEAVAHRYTGVQVLAVECDAELDFCSEPDVLASFGEVPG